ncbi:hypothetical protein IHE45_15G024100 [Dioscorea alata]|uniref:Uncharacterized protein n=1 Tax=Dioscorea alata TaxID=55571 RepID=A0ACB7UK69_DIOAL|nr:hypothetical protein IHE45_15G024100 [Dioscorea alata]
MSSRRYWPDRRPPAMPARLADALLAGVRAWPALPAHLCARAALALCACASSKRRASAPTLAASAARPPARRHSHASARVRAQARPASACDQRQHAPGQARGQANRPANARPSLRARPNPARAHAWPIRGLSVLLFMMGSIFGPNTQFKP